MNRLTTLILAIGLVLAACGDGAAPAGTSLVTEPPAAPATSVAPEPSVATTAATSTTTPPPTTALPPATTAPTTTVPAPTTTVPAPSTTLAPAAPAVTSVDVYLFDGDRRDEFGDAPLVAIPREIPATTAVGTAAMEQLVAGPTPSESGRYWTAVPVGSRFLGLEVADGVVTVDMSAEFESGGGTAAIGTRLAQLVHTLTQFPTVDGVAIAIDGQRVDSFSGEGFITDRPLTREDFPYTAVGEFQHEPPAGTYSVVLVAPDDALNVRSGPGVTHDVIGTLGPEASGFSLTGRSELVDGSWWVEFALPASGWVNSHFLARDVPADEFAGDVEIQGTLAELAATIERGGDLAHIASERGLHVQTFDPPGCEPGFSPSENFYRFRPAELPTLLASTELRKWGTLGAHCEEVQPATFAEAVGSFPGVLSDESVALVYDEPREGGHGFSPPELAIPVELANFHYVAVHRQGEFGPDWVTWYVFVDYDSGRPRVVGMRSTSSGA